ncbi:MAG: hypothetical protein RI897_798 [Verrucomicrobiota bacterium]
MNGREGGWFWTANGRYGCGSEPRMDAKGGGSEPRMDANGREWICFATANGREGGWRLRVVFLNYGSVGPLFLVCDLGLVYLGG